MNLKSILAIALIMSLGLVAGSPVFAGAPCVTKNFKTELAKAACAKGGQEEAKKAWKAWMDQAKKTNKDVATCKSCHTTQAPKFELKANAVDLFKKAGGK